LGIWFLIQSPNKGCEYLTSAINKWILEKREIIKNISDEEFNQQKKSIHTIFAEKDTNLSKVNSRFWGEISNHSYIFDRQEKQLKTIEEISKNDFINHFEEVFFSKNSKRLDLQLSSKSHSEE
jgi:secreted Zn-dependent insulinase-like peptidase